MCFATLRYILKFLRILLKLKLKTKQFERCHWWLFWSGSLNIIFIVGGGCSWAALNGLKWVEEWGENLMSSIQNETPSIVFTLGSGTEYLQPPEKAIDVFYGLRGSQFCLLFCSEFPSKKENSAENSAVFPFQWKFYVHGKRGLGWLGILTIHFKIYICSTLRLF